VKRLLAHLRRLLRDVLFIRVCTAIYGVPIAGLGLVGLWQVHSSQPPDWLLVLFLVLLAGWGSFMTYGALFGSTDTLARAAEGVSEGGEFIGIILLILVLLVALPITGALRAIQRAVS
jgi:hypothetical protein